MLTTKLIWFVLVFVSFVLFRVVHFVWFFPLESFLCCSLQGPHSLKYPCPANLRKSGAGESCQGSRELPASFPHLMEDGGWAGGSGYHDHC